MKAAGIIVHRISKHIFLPNAMGSKIECRIKHKLTKLILCVDQHQKNRCYS